MSAMFVSQLFAHVMDDMHSCRNMPVLLPSELFPWMMGCGIWPEDAACPERTKKYWQHLKDVGSPLANMSPEGDHIPIYLWGDGAQFTESGQSVLVLACGLVMDDKRTNIFPLFLCREGAWLQKSQCSLSFKCLHVIMLTHLEFMRSWWWLAKPMMPFLNSSLALM